MTHCLAGETKGTLVLWVALRMLRIIHWSYEFIVSYNYGMHVLGIETQNTY